MTVTGCAASSTSAEEEVFDINPRRIGAVGGSYGGGFSWLALTDPTWSSPLHGVGMKLGAVVPKYGWTDLVEALAPSGHYRDRDLRTNRTVIAPSDPPAHDADGDPHREAELHDRCFRLLDRGTGSTTSVPTTG